MVCGDGRAKGDSRQHCLLQPSVYAARQHAELLSTVHSTFGGRLTHCPPKRNWNVICGCETELGHDWRFHEESHSCAAIESACGSSCRRWHGASHWRRRIISLPDVLEVV